MELKRSISKTSHNSTPVRQFSQLIIKDESRFFLNLKGSKFGASHVSTAFLNPDGSLSQAYISIDVDFDKTESIWLKGGVVCFKKIKQAIQTYLPFLMDHLVSACRSSGGKGLHLVFSISPFPIGHKNFVTAKDTFILVNRLIVKAFDSLGIGADAHAVSTNRLTMNWFNKAHVIEYNSEAEKIVWSRSARKRIPVLSTFHKALKNHPLVVGRAKKDICQTLETRDVLLYPHEESEVKVAKLFDHVFMEHDGQWEASISEITEVCDLDPQTVRRIKNLDLACGLRVEKVCHGEWRVIASLTDSRFSKRIHQLLEPAATAPERKESANVELIPLDCLWHPSEVDPDAEGERNQWLTSATIWLKICGVDQDTTAKIIGRAVTLIPGYELSSKCQRWFKVVKSIFYNRPSTFGCLPRERIPKWLLHLNEPQPLSDVEKGHFPSKKPSVARLASDLSGGEFWLDFQGWVDRCVPESEREAVSEFLVLESNRKLIVNRFGGIRVFSLSRVRELILEEAV